jgi:hypothetical protein
MSPSSPSLRHADVLGHRSRVGPATAAATQTELEVMHSIVRALATIPDQSARVRVLGWAAICSAPEVRQKTPAQLHLVPDVPSDARGLESFRSETGLALRPAGSARPTPVSEISKRTPIKPPSEPTALHGPASTQPAAGEGGSETSASLSAKDAEALSIKDVETLFDDTRPHQGQFPFQALPPRTLSPRLVLRFRLWK